MATQKRRRRRKLKKDSKLGLLLDVTGRIIATYVASALAFIGGGAIIGVDVWMSAALGGLIAIFKVIEKLALAYVEDGVLDRKEVNQIFSQVVKLKEAQEDAKK